MEAEQLNNQLNNRLSRCFDIDTRNIELLVSSPLRRALHTADLVFSGMLNEVPRVVQSDARERLYLSSDVGSMKNELVVAFPQWDYSSLSDYAWWFTGPEFGVPYVEWRPPGKYACLGEPDSVFRTRIKALKSWLLNRPGEPCNLNSILHPILLVLLFCPEQTILLVSHWGVIRALTGWSLSNCEIRACAADLLLQEAYIDP